MEIDKIVQMIGSFNWNDRVLPRHWATRSVTASTVQLWMSGCWHRTF